MSDMQVAVRFGWKPGHDTPVMLAASIIGGDDLADKILAGAIAGLGHSGLRLMLKFIFADDIAVCIAALLLNLVEKRGRVSSVLLFPRSLEFGGAIGFSR